ncbi:MAG: hypothetical protein GY862_29895 [Gammaproteobacteria bacterium]|nr:hypothetical protein [Gammaproteobacteria bacterium]
MKYVSIQYWAIIFGISIILTSIAYWPSADAWFVLDDYKWLEEISYQKLFSYFHSSWGHGAAYRPLMRVSFFIDRELFAENPVVWHYHNYILHACNAAWLFLIVQILGRNFIVSALASVFFTLAPWGHENIAWISARTHLLSAFFYLAALFCVLAHFFHKKKLYLILSFPLLLCGLMSYEMAVSFPLVIALCLFFFREKAGLNKRQIFSSAFSYALFVMVFLIFRYYMLHQSSGAVNAHHASYLPGLFENILLVWHMFIDFAAGKACLFFIGAFMGYSLWRKDIKAFNYAMLLILLGFAFYLPFSVVAGVAYRFLYLSQITLVLGAAACVYALFRQKNGYLLIASLVLASASGYNSFNLSKEWGMAGFISETIPEQVKTIYPEKPKGYNFVFKNIPNNYGYAFVFVTYFDLAISRKYREFDGHVLRGEDLRSASMSDIEPAKFFVYDEKNHTISEISAAQWKQTFHIERKILPVTWRDKNARPNVIHNMDGHVDLLEIKQNSIQIRGWVNMPARQDGQILYVIQPQLPIAYKHSAISRPDVAKHYNNEELNKSGFTMSLTYEHNADFDFIAKNTCVAYSSEQTPLTLLHAKNSICKLPLPAFNHP